jgi:hypothetical protein
MDALRYIESKHWLTGLVNALMLHWRGKTMTLGSAHVWDGPAGLAVRIEPGTTETSVTFTFLPSQGPRLDATYKLVDAASGLASFLAAINRIYQGTRDRRAFSALTHLDVIRTEITNHLANKD